MNEVDSKSRKNAGNWIRRWLLHTETRRRGKGEVKCGAGDGEEEEEEEEEEELSLRNVSSARWRARLYLDDYISTLYPPPPPLPPLPHPHNLNFDYFPTADIITIIVIMMTAISSSFRVRNGNAGSSGNVSSSLKCDSGLGGRGGVGGVRDELIKCSLITN